MSNKIVLQISLETGLKHPDTGQDMHVYTAMFGNKTIRVDNSDTLIEIVKQMVEPELWEGLDRPTG
jgi:hypothetical protein